MQRLLTFPSPPPLLHSSLYTLFRNPYYRLLTYSHYSMKSTSSLPKSFSIDDTSFILLHSLFLLFSHPTVVVSGDPLQDCAHSFTMIWPIWRDLVHIATSVHTLHATPHCAYPRALWAQHVPQTGNKSNDCPGSQHKRAPNMVLLLLLLLLGKQSKWNETIAGCQHRQQQQRRGKECEMDIKWRLIASD